MRASPTRWALPTLIIVIMGCATAPSAGAPRDRYSPAQMREGPSLHETGRFGVVPLSSAGLRIDEGAIDRPTPARPRPARTAERARGKHKARAHAQRVP